MKGPRRRSGIKTANSINTTFQMRTNPLSLVELRRHVAGHLGLTEEFGPAGV